MKQQAVGAVISTLIIGTPFIAFAGVSATNGSLGTMLSSQAQSLLQQISDLQAQISAMGGSSGSATTGGQSISNTSAGGSYTGGSCPNIQRVLSIGSSGSDVSSLQTFLAQDPSIYPEGLVTGHFGPATQAAVRRWQIKNNIVSSGSPSTTGFGMVGPRTAAAMLGQCGQVSQGGQQDTSQVGGYIQVSPTSGTAPVAVTIQAFVNTVNNCNPFTYTLDYGDGSPLAQIPTNGSCALVTQTFQHTYTYGGTYQIVLSAGSHRTSAVVMVTGATNQQQPQVSNVVVPGDSMRASITSGLAPLTVIFSGTVSSNSGMGCQGTCNETINYGDGQIGLIPIPMTPGSWQSYNITHVYQNPGQYVATLQSVTGGQIGASTNITVGAQATVATSSGSYGIVNVGPASADTVNTVNMMVAIPSCAAFQVAWGDGQTSNTANGACTSGGSQILLSHTYAHSGSFQIILKDGSGNLQTSSSYQF